MFKRCNIVEPCVINIGDKALIILNVDKNLKQLISKKYTVNSSWANPGYLKVKYKGELELANLLNFLRDQNVIFAYDYGISPSSVVKYLRRKGILHGSFKEIAWKNKEEYIIYEIKNQEEKNDLKS